MTTVLPAYKQEDNFEYVNSILSQNISIRISNAADGIRNTYDTLPFGLRMLAFVLGKLQKRYS